MRADPRLTVATDPDVYPPREDTYLLLEALDVRPGERFLEVGTGTGLVALHAAKVARAVATDVSPAAVRLARGNAAANGLSLAVVRCDLFRGLRGTFDVIAFNPPYLAEPVGGDWVARTWQGGPAGDELILRFLRKAPEHLADEGRIYVIVPSSYEKLRPAAGPFRSRTVASRHMFFEELLALELVREKGKGRG